VPLLLLLFSLVFKAWISETTALLDSKQRGFNLGCSGGSFLLLHSGSAKKKKHNHLHEETLLGNFGEHATLFIPPA